MLHSENLLGKPVTESVVELLLGPYEANGFLRIFFVTEKPAAFTFRVSVCSFSAMYLKSFAVPLVHSKKATPLAWQ